MERTNEQIEVTAQTTDVEDINGASEQISLGKFKDVNSLLKAYNSLEAEFTRRCQRIKELEGAERKGQVIPPESSVGAQVTDAGISDEEKNRIIGDYLKNLVTAKQSAILISDSGVAVKTPVSKPKTIKEAGYLAKEKLK